MDDFGASGISKGGDISKIDSLPSGRLSYTHHLGRSPNSLEKLGTDFEESWETKLSVLYSLPRWLGRRSRACCGWARERIVGHLSFSTHRKPFFTAQACCWGLSLATDIVFAAVQPILNPQARAAAGADSGTFRQSSLSSSARLLTLAAQVASCITDRKSEGEGSTPTHAVEGQQFQFK